MDRSGPPWATSSSPTSATATAPSIGQVYADLFPDGCGRWSSTAWSTPRPRARVAASRPQGSRPPSRNWAAGCRTASVVSLRRRRSAPSTRCSHGPRTGVPASGGARTLGPGEAALGLAYPLYAAGAVGRARRRRGRRARRRRRGMVALADRYTGIADFAIYFAVSCLDSTGPRDTDDVPAAGQGRRRVAPRLRRGDRQRLHPLRRLAGRPRPARRHHRPRARHRSSWCRPPATRPRPTRTAWGGRPARPASCSPTRARATPSCSRAALRRRPGGRLPDRPGVPPTAPAADRGRCPGAAPFRAGGRRPPPAQSRHRARRSAVGHRDRADAGAVARPEHRVEPARVDEAEHLPGCRRGRSRGTRRRAAVAAFPVSFAGWSRVRRGARWGPRRSPRPHADRIRPACRRRRFGEDLPVSESAGPLTQPSMVAASPNCTDDMTSTALIGRFASHGSDAGRRRSARGHVHTPPAPCPVPVEQCLLYGEVGRRRRSGRLAGPRTRSDGRTPRRPRTGPGAAHHRSSTEVDPSSPGIARDSTHLVDADVVVKRSWPRAQSAPSTGTSTLVDVARRTPRLARRRARTRTMPASRGRRRAGTAARSGRLSSGCVAAASQEVTRRGRARGRPPPSGSRSAAQPVAGRGGLDRSGTARSASVFTARHTRKPTASTATPNTDPMITGTRRDVTSSS